MKDSVHYTNAPITEAIIDLRVRFDADGCLEKLKQVGEEIESEYPQEDKIVEAIGHMEVNPGVGGSTSMRQQTLGFKRTSEDKIQIVQSRRNGFTFSRLAPYDRWEPFRDEAKRLWEVFRRTTEPAEILRLAVRYINRIDIPAEQVDLKEYFRTSPEISPDLSQEVERFFMQLRLPQSDISGFAVLNQTIVPPAREGVTSIILDVDLVRDREVPQKEEDIWAFFELLHGVKNEIFEACITENSRKLLESWSA